MNQRAFLQQPKGEKRARTRAALIKAASELVREKGFERTSLEDVARRANMTSGAIYGNFKNKDELFLAVVEVRWPQISPHYKPGASYPAQMRILAQAVIDAVPARRAAAIGGLSFQMYALENEHLRLRTLEIGRELYRRAAEDLLAVIPKKELPMPAQTFVRVTHSLIEGLLSQRFLTPELITDDVIRAAFDAMARIPVK